MMNVLRSIVFPASLKVNRFHNIRLLGAQVKKRNVAVCGSSGGIGQALCLLLKANHYISELRLYDIRGAPGVTADLSHIETGVKVLGFTGLDEIDKCLKGVDVVIIPAGMPRKPGMTRDDLFSTNASICAEIVDKCAQYCPEACIGIITNPVNSTLPIASEVLKHRGVFNKDKLFGITSLDGVRARTFVSELKNLDVTKLKVDVVAGHSPETIVPLLSQVEPSVSLSDKEIRELTERIKNAGTEVVNAKAGAGSATLSMAYAGALFTNSLLAALSGEKNIVECTMTASDRPGVGFFAEPHLLGKHGVEKRLGIKNLSEFEKSLMEIATKTLKTNIEKGVKFGKEFTKKL